MPRFLQNLRSHLKKDWAGAAIGVLLAVSAGVLLHMFTFGSGLVNLSYDLLLVARPHLPAPEAAVVYLDEKSHMALNQPYNAPWDRALHARLIDRLSAVGARAIVFDIVFSDPNPLDAAADQVLAEAIRKSGRVILAADNVPTGTEENYVTVPPFDLVRDASVGIGSAEIVPSRDLIVRLHTPHKNLPALSWATAEFLKAKITQRPEQKGVVRWMNYYGPADYLLGTSYAEVLNAEAKALEVFRDKVVFIGARIFTKFSGDRKDEYRTPHSFWISERPFISGVEIQATACSNLLRGDWLRRWGLGTERCTILLFGILFGYGLARFTPWSATGAALGGAIIVTFLSYQLFRQWLVWFPWMIIVAVQIPLAFAWSVVFNSVKLYVQNRLLQQTLSLHLSPKRVKQLLRNRSDIQRLLRPGAEKQLLTVIFTDIENFTAFAEGMDSDDLANVMNNYFQTATDRCIHGTDGTVVKYIGDAIFAFWNAPDLQPDHQERACQAALLLRDQVLTFSKKKTTWTMRTRIGLHTGVANVGNFGSATRIDYTAIGETINLASRMEGLNKYLGTHVLVTEDTQVGIAQRFVTRCLGKFQLKGFERTVGVYELMGLISRAETTQTLREAFAKALEQFQKGHLDAAKACFDHVLEVQQNDGPAKFYLAKIAEFKDQPPGEGWAGEVELKEK